MDKLIYTLPQTADRLARVQLAVENELRRRLQLMFGELGKGIWSITGDVATDTAPLALVPSAANNTTFDVLPGTALFGNGELIDCISGDLVLLEVPGVGVDYVVRLTYTETPTGSTVTSRHYSTSGPPVVAKGTPVASLVIETVTAYNALSALIKANSVVLGTVYKESLSGPLALDNSRALPDARPWASVRDMQHRLQVGTGIQTDTNPHALSAGDLSVGDFTLWQAMMGTQNGVVSRPRTLARVPGEVCVDVIAAGAWQADSGGVITGVVGALWGRVQRWPDRLISATTVGLPVEEVAAWNVPGTQIIAVAPVANMSPAQDVSVTYSRTVAASLPNLVDGRQTLTLSQPVAGELLVAGGVMRSVIVDPTLTFTDVGLLPGQFDVKIDAQGRVYKDPEVILCAMALADATAVAVPMDKQPRTPRRLAVGLFGYAAAFTQVDIRVVGKSVAGLTVTEDLTFTGATVPALAAISNQPLEIVNPARPPYRWTANEYASVTSVQAVLRTGDGAATRMTVFAVPTGADSEDALVAKLFWNGGSIEAPTAQFGGPQIDTRQVRGAAAASNSAQLLALLSAAGGTPGDGTAGENSSVFVELFSDPRLGFVQRWQEQGDEGASRSNRWPSIRHEDPDPVIYESRLLPLRRSWTGLSAVLSTVDVLVHPDDTTAVGNITVEIDFINNVGAVAATAGPMSVTELGGSGTNRAIDTVLGIVTPIHAVKFRLRNLDVIRTRVLGLRVEMRPYVTL